MLTIKLSRIGKKKQPTYRLIVLEKAKDPWGDFLEDLGFYNPKTKVKSFKKERIEYWMKKGAQPSGTVFNLLVDEKIVKGPKVKVAKIKKKTEAEKKEEAAKEKAPEKKEEAPKA